MSLYDRNDPPATREKALSHVNEGHMKRLRATRTRLFGIMDRASTRQSQENLNAEISTLEHCMSTIDPCWMSRA